MPPLRSQLQRLWSSTVVWSWIFNGVRLTFGLLLLPVILHFLSGSDLGMYYVFWSLIALLPLVESTFSFNVGRQVTFAMGGAVRLLPQGTDNAAASGRPNYSLVWRLVDATQLVYVFLTASVVGLLGVFGTSIVVEHIPETSHPTFTWVAWAFTLGGTAVELQSLRWLGFLRNMNLVRQSDQLGSATYAGRTLLTCLLLVLGAGLLAFPVAGTVSSLVLGRLARRACLLGLPGPRPGRSRGSDWELLRVIWPNTWRVGLKLASIYLANVALVSLCSHKLGLVAAGQYGLSVQIMNIVQQLAMVWVTVKWPIVGQLRAQKNLAAMRAILWSRDWLQNLTFLLGATLAVLGVPAVLPLVGSGKSVLPQGWLALLALNHFLYLRFAFWVFLIATDNRLPSLWPTVITNASTIVLAGVLLQTTDLELGALVLAPLLAGCLFNYWYWMFVGARDLGTSWWRFLRSPTVGLSRPGED